ncbi:type VI secretion system baseplate subunit TssG [Pseudomonas segetis]
MDATHGATAPAISRLSRGIREYSLFQGVQLVLKRLQEAHPELDEESLHLHLELQANPSLGFPGSDIERVEFIEENGELRARMCINLVSLIGSGSPLPAFYGEQALGDGEDGNPTRDFLDLFNNRLQRLLLPVWQKYRYHSRFKTGALDQFSQQLFSLIGLRGEKIRATSELNWKRLLPYLGLLSLRAHSAALIESVLRYYFKHSDVYIEQFIERRVEILAEQRNQLGTANSMLGESLVLGGWVRDRGGKFRVHIRELQWDMFQQFLPVGSGYNPLCALVRFTLRDPMDYDIRLQLRKDQIKELRIGNDNLCRLGWTSWLGCDNADGIVTLGKRAH